MPCLVRWLMLFWLLSCTVVFLLFRQMGCQSTFLLMLSIYCWSFLSNFKVFVWFQPNLLEELSQANGLCEFPRKTHKEKRERIGKSLSGEKRIIKWSPELTASRQGICMHYYFPKLYLQNPKCQLSCTWLWSHFTLAFPLNFFHLNFSFGFFYTKNLHLKTVFWNICVFFSLVADEGLGKIQTIIGDAVTSFLSFQGSFFG